MTLLKDFFSKTEEKMSLKVAMNLMIVQLINDIAIHIFKGFRKFQRKKLSLTEMADWKLQVCNLQNYHTRLYRKDSNLIVIPKCRSIPQIVIPQMVIPQIVDSNTVDSDTVDKDTVDCNTVIYRTAVYRNVCKQKYNITRNMKLQHTML